MSDITYADWQAELDALRDKTPQYKCLTKEVKDAICWARFGKPEVVKFKELSEYINKRFGFDIPYGTLKDWALRIKAERGLD